MKRKILLILIIVLGLTGCLDNKKNISKRIDLNLDKCEIVNLKDTHGGFLGDGELYAKMKCSNDLKDVIISKWNKLPVSDSIKEVMEMDIYQKYNIPDIENGYYYFVDRHSDVKDIHNSSDLNNRVSYNFSLALYDIDNNTLYYYELDT